MNANFPFSSQASKVDVFEKEILKYKERLNELEFYKARTEVSAHKVEKISLYRDQMSSTLIHISSSTK